MHAEGGDQEQPANLEQGGAEVNHSIVLNDSAAHVIKKPIKKEASTPAQENNYQSKPPLPPISVFAATMAPFLESNGNSHRTF